MAKRAQYYSDAERAYVQEQRTCAEIATRFSLGIKTVETWRKDGRWEERRKQFLTEESAFHEDLFRLCRSLMRNIQADLDAGQKIDPGRMYAFNKLIPQFTKAKEYEDSMAAQREGSNPARELTPEVVKMIEKEVLGIERK